MQNPAVHWSEGMFLRPHHFQAADRYWSELAGLNSKLDHPYGYGVFHLSCSAESIANGMLELSGIKARFRDGTVIAMEPNEVLKADLNIRLESIRSSTEPVAVYLALPVASEGRANVSPSAVDGRVRYAGVTREIDDESVGGNRQSVDLRVPQCRLLFSNDDLSGFDVLPLFRLVRSSADARQYGIDPNYFPPVLSVQSWPELAELHRDIWHFIGNRLKSMGSIVRETGASLSSQVEGDMEKMMLMHVMNEAYGELSCLAHASGVHPLVAYTALCGIVGRCSIFGPNVAIEEVPFYDHDDLARIFRWAVEQIRRLINSVKDDECVQRYFKGAGKGMRVVLDPEWFDPEWEWYFGCQPINTTVEETIALFRRDHRDSIDWKLGASEKVEQYLEKRQPCLIIGLVKQLPRALSNRRKWAFFKILQEGEPWDAVRSSQTMGFRMPTQQIKNLDTLENSQRLQVTVNGRLYSMEFAIFAVKKRI